VLQADLLETLYNADAGESIHSLAAEIFPICRSITGDGVRETLGILSNHIPIQMHEVASGTPVFDWVVPREWNIRDAYVKTSDGTKIIDFAQSNLHVLNYSVPVRGHVGLDELNAHLYSLPDQPDAIPYRTSYYAEDWGFCVTHRQREAFKDDTYEVVIDSELKDGSLTWGEYLHEGETAEEVLLSAHICHPSLANDNCSGLALLTYLAKQLKTIRTRHSYRFLYAPGTIGAITWLATRNDEVQRIKHGLVLSCVGDSGNPSYKRSRRGNAVIDRAVAHVLAGRAQPGTVHDFSPYGYDERQFCSPGLNLPVGLFQRSRFGKFPEYHTSADNLEFIGPESLADSYKTILNVIEIIENDRKFVNLNPICEPQLGRRGLYGSIGGNKNAPDRHMAMLWVLNLSDGSNSLLSIAERAQLPFIRVLEAARLLVGAQLLAEVDQPKS
jgi:aminopeptidase-like protein